MADIKDYLKEKEKREKAKGDYRNKIARHKLTTIYRILLVLVIIVAVIAIVVVQYNRRIFTGYETLSSIPREKAADAIDIRLRDSVLTYSKDGAHCTNAKGTVTWNQTYEIQDVKIAKCMDVTAIADYNGRSIYVQSADKLLGQITTTMPVQNIAVSANGTVTAILEDKDITWINTYNANGEMLYTGQTHMHDSGYPAAISLSPNGDLLAVSYIYVDAGELKSNVVFYNFGPVGANQSDYLVSTHIYTDQLVPELHFINDNTAFAVSDSSLMIYKGSQKPTQEAIYFYENEVRSVFYDENYIGIVFLSDKPESTYKIEVYGTDGKKVGTYYFDLDYRQLFFGKDYFAVYNETESMIMTLEGTEKYSGSFAKSVNLMLPTNRAYKFLLVTDTSIDTIQLK